MLPCSFKWRTSYRLWKKLAQSNNLCLLLVVWLFSDYKQPISRQHIAKYSVLNTIGVYQQHIAWWTTTHHVMDNNTSTGKEKKGLLSSIITIYSKALMNSLYGKVLFERQYISMNWMRNELNPKQFNRQQHT